MRLELLLSTVANRHSNLINEARVSERAAGRPARTRAAPEEANWANRLS